MFGGLGWMGALVTLLAAVAVVGYVLVLMQCAEKDWWADHASGRRALEATRRVRGVGDVTKRAA
jgi:hypothetical protein